MSLARTLALRAACIFLAGLPALAVAAPACGVYRSAEGGRELRVESVATATEYTDYQAPRPLAYQAQADGRITAYDLESAYAEHWTPEAGGRALRTEMDTLYTLAEPAHCVAPPPAPAGSCRADPAACFEAKDNADEATLTRWCEQEGLPFACVALIDGFQDAADRQQQGDALSEEPPPECTEGHPAHSEAACEEKVKQALTQAFADAFKGMYADDVPLSAAHLDRGLALCRRSGSAKVCGEAAEKLWNGGRYLDARDALAVACEQGKDKDACGKAAPLAVLATADLRAPAPVALPCGAYAAESGLMSELGFGDAGRVEGGFGSVMRARLEDGLIRIRHDKGGDFVFKVIGGDRLLGLDSWNRYALYQRGEGGAGRCAPPRRFIEQPLVEDCPAIGREGGAEACCKAGKLQGCNALGHAQALAGNWAGAQPHYLRICAAGVRVGCENLIRAYAETGDDTVIESMRAVCAKDERHVACDVLETSNWEQMGVGRALQDALRELEQEAGEDVPEEGEATP
nr:hypothetical protein [Pseudoxanthomonas sp.]